MTNHVARLYAVALALLVFFLTWAVVAARPWDVAAPAEKDPRLVALERREARLRRQSVRVQRTVERRFARYEKRLRERRQEIAAVQAAQAPTGSPVAATSGSASAPSVEVVSLPPLTQSGSS